MNLAFQPGKFAGSSDRSSGLQSGACEQTSTFVHTCFCILVLDDMNLLPACFQFKDPSCLLSEELDLIFWQLPGILDTMGTCPLWSPVLALLLTGERGGLGPSGLLAGRCRSAQWCFRLFPHCFCHFQKALSVGLTLMLRSSGK